MTDFTTNTGSGGTTFTSDTEASWTPNPGHDVPVSKMAWGALGSGVRVDYPTPAPVQQAAMYFPASTANSSTAQLAAAGVFTGTFESILGQPAVLISLVVDQNCTLVVTQSVLTGGSEVCQTWTIPVVANIPINQCLDVVGNYLQVKLTNNGASTTTTLNLNTYYGSMLPTSNSGALAVAGQMTTMSPISLATSSATQIVDVAGQSSGTIAVTSVGTGGAFNVTCSVDGVNWNAANVVINDAGGYVSSIAATGVYQFTVTGFSFVKFTATALTSGTITGNFRAGPGDYQVSIDPTGLQTTANSQSVCLASDQLVAASTQPTFAQAALPVADRATGAINATAPSSAFYAAGSYNSTLPTLTTGQLGALQLTTKGEQLVALSSGGTAVGVAAASTQPTFATPAMVVADRATGATAAAVPSSIMYMGATFTTTQPTITSGQLFGLQATSRGELLVSLSNAGTAVPTVAASTANAATNAALSVALSPNSPMPATTSASQACTNINVNAVGATVTAVKASAGNLFGMSMVNNNAATVFVEFWNVATGSVTLGTTVPTCVFAIAASGVLNIPPGAMALLNSATAISFAAVTAYNGSTGGSVTGSIFYK